MAWNFMIPMRHIRMGVESVIDEDPRVLTLFDALVIRSRTEIT